MEGGKKNKGKQKIQIKKIENGEEKMITFSKRKSGIQKKASELATLCGANVGFLVFSPTGKPFTFGTPSFEAVANRFLNNSQPAPMDDTQIFMEAQREMRINILTQQYNELMNQLEAEKERAEVLKEQAKLLKDKSKLKATNDWWEAPIEDQNIEELQKLYASFEDLRTKLHNKFNEKFAAQASSAVLPPMNPGGDEANPFSANTNETDHPSTFPPGHDHFQGGTY